jgi:hypothetical protein
MTNFLSPLQHERKHSTEEAWVARWENMVNEDSKINFLAMLKERRDLRGDDSAGRVLLELNQRWLSEKYIP